MKLSDKLTQALDALGRACGVTRKRRRRHVTRGLGSTDCGEVQWKLAGMLTEALKPFGALRQPVHPADFYRTKGYWTHKHQDVMPWTTTVNLDGRSFNYTVGCWNTMTECVRRGITVEDCRKGRAEADFMVSARPRKK